MTKEYLWKLSDVEKLKIYKRLGHEELFVATKSLMTQAWLAEAYKKTNTDFVNDFANCYIAYLNGKIDAKTFSTIQYVCNISITIDEAEKLNIFLVKGRYIKQFDIFNISINNYTKSLIKSSKKYQNLFKKKLAELLVHEDTHKQQAKQYYDYDKNYIENTPETEDLYYNQKIEADAFGRQIGKALRLLYPNKSVDDIFSIFNHKTVKDPYLQSLIDVYKSSRVSEKIKKKFIRALYDFLEGQEED